MAVTATRYGHIVLAAAGTPLIADTTMKVIELVLNQQAHGWSPEELHFQHSYPLSRADSLGAGLLLGPQGSARSRHRAPPCSG